MKTSLRCIFKLDIAAVMKIKNKLCLKIYSFKIQLTVHCALLL